MWLMLQQDEPDDYVIATGEQHSVREFVLRAFEEVGVTLRFDGTGRDEVGTVARVDPARLERARNGHGSAGAVPGDDVLRGDAVLVRVDPRYFRPTEVETLLGDAGKARERLGWQATTGLAELVREMVWDDLAEAQRDELLKREGFVVREFRE